MLLWWLTACLSFRSATHFLARLLYATAVMFWASNQIGGGGGNDTLAAVDQTQTQIEAAAVFPRDTQREKAAEEATMRNSNVSADAITTTDSIDLTSTTMASSSTSTSPPSTASPASSSSSPFGVFSYGSSQNFNNYLKELGVSYLLRTFAGMASPIVTISRDCNGKVRGSRGMGHF